MLRTQVYLTTEQKRGLERLTATTGKRQSGMIREAIAAYLAGHDCPDWKSALSAAQGMWADRDDLVGELRGEWETRLERIHRR